MNVNVHQAARFQTALGRLVVALTGLVPLTAFSDYPIGGGAVDDSAVLQTAITTLAGTGYGLFIPAGTYVVANPLILASNVRIVCGPGVTFVTTFANTGTGGFSNALFYAPFVPANATQYALTANAVIGSNVLTVASTAGLSVGQVIRLRMSASGNVAMQATIVALTATTVTLDEEVLSSLFTTANTAFFYVGIQLTDIILDGGYCQVYGTGDRIVEMVGVRNFHVERFISNPLIGPASSPGFLNIQFGMDIGCRDGVVQGCRADGGTGYLTAPIGTAGFSQEATNRCEWRNNVAQNFSANPGYGFFCAGARNGIAYNCTGRNNTGSGGGGCGWYFGDNDSSGTEGTRMFTCVGCSTENNTIGWYLDKASQVVIYNPVMNGDATMISVAGTTSSGTPWVVFHGVNAKAKQSGACNLFNVITGDLFLSGLYDCTGAAGTATICDWGSATSGTLHIRDFTQTGGTYGFFFENNGAQHMDVGPGVNIGATTPIAGPGLGITPVWNAFYQHGAVVIAANTTIKWTQAATLVVTAAATINVPAIPDLVFDVDNSASAGTATVQPTGGTSRTVTTGNMQRMKVNHAATSMQFVGSAVAA